MEGDVLVEVSHSSVNYKDGLAITGKAPIIRKFPLIPGIDFAGTVRESSHPKWKAGDQVVLNGWGVGEQSSMAASPNWRASRATGWCRYPRAGRRPTAWPLAWRAIPPCSA